MWKGDNVNIRASLHEWIRYNLPQPEFCQICQQKPPYDLANITGIYNRDFINWLYLCRGCHMRFDYKNGIRKTKPKKVKILKRLQPNYIHPMRGKRLSEEAKEKRKLSRYLNWL